MKRVIFFVILINLTFSSFAQSGSREKKLKFFDSGMLFFERVFPGNAAYNQAGVPNYNLIGLEGDFFQIKKGNWLWEQRITGDIGGKKSEDLISDIEFEGGYKGGFSVWSNRFSLSLGSVIGHQFTPKFEVGLPLLFCSRMTSEIGSYYLYEGQNIDPNDEVSASVAGSSNRLVINRKWMPGLKSGIEFTIFPNSELSLMMRFNYHYFGWRDVYDVSTAKLIPATNTILVDNQRVDNTSEWGITIGLKYTVIEIRKGGTTKKTKKEDDPKVILTPKKRQ